MVMDGLKEIGILDSEFSLSNLEELIKEAAEEFFMKNSDSTIALILTGSVARGEGTFLSDGHGGIRHLGDVEFLLVSESSARGNALAAEFEGRLWDLLVKAGIETSVDVGYVRPDYFESLKPHIFGVELKTHGKVLAGDGSTLERIPDFSAKDIPRFDALHLLYNRMVEQMMVLDGLLVGGPEDIRKAHYQNIKFTLDVAGSLLVFQGSYRTTYLERMKAVRQAVEAIEHSLTRKSLSGLPEDLKYWTSIKLNPQSDSILSWNGDSSQTECNREAVLKRWLELVRIVQSLWVWEMNNYTDGKWSDETETLLKRYLKSERLGLRIHGWAKWLSRVRSSGAVPYARLLKLFPVGSPRALIYASAALLYFSLPDALEKNKDSHWMGNAKKAGELLPAFSEAETTDWTSICSSIAGSWKEHVKNG